VHDFGVVLLELLTGRRPSGEDGGGAQADLPRWARAAVREEWASEVLDVELQRGRGAEDEMVALLCVAEEPGERPSIASLRSNLMRTRKNIVKSCVTFCPLANELCLLDMW